MTAIANVSTPSPAEWDALWAACEYATYYQSRQWAELWSWYAPGKHRPAPRLVTFADGFRALVPLTITRQARGFLDMYESSPYNTYGGWLSADPLDAGHAALLAGYLRRLPNLNWMLNPFEPAALALTQGKGEATWTRVLDLTKGMQALSKEARYGYRYGVKAGLTARLLREADMDAAFAVYQANQSRWQHRRTAFERRLFTALVNLPNADFLGAFQGGELVAANLALRGPRHVAVWLGFARPAALRSKVFAFMDATLVERYAQAGYLWYDLHPSGDRPTLDQAKKSTGAAAWPVRILRRRTPVYLAAHWARELAHGLAERVHPAEG